jgi:hypothetical protein
MSSSKIKAVTAKYKADLAAKDQHAASILNAGYSSALSKIQPTLNHLMKQIADAQAKGEKINPSWLHEQNRLKAIQSIIEQEMTQYGNLSQAVTQQLQQQALQLGRSAGMDQLNASVPAGFSYTFGVPSTSALHSLIGAASDGSPLSTLFDSFGVDASSAVRQALFAGLVLGNNPRQTAASVQQALGVSRARALTISRDQMINAYRSANLSTFQANSDVVDKWIWSANLAKACIACVLMNGTLHDLDEDMDSHVQCACVPIPQTKPWPDIFSGTGIDTSSLSDDTMSLPSGEDWFNDQDEATQRDILGNAKYEALQSGDVSSVTDFLGTTHSSQWGTSIYVKPLKDLVS